MWPTGRCSWYERGDKVPILTVPRVLRDKLGEDGADALVALLNAATEQGKGETLTFVEEKFERRLAETAASFERRLAEEVARLEVRIAEAKADLVRWMFLFWIGQIGALLGILFAFFRK
ncbi:MAG: hypothetical protein KatS3mg131_2297 [Candidatus Tectimicrobiota bacterium]|nr:MAG: hypothetical protein KatS3mg131_2297 [Candidatus Tectomicrobia bacterium]